jgi:general nucleoside transport system ATP-binding protein
MTPDTSATTAPPLLSLKGIVKRFGRMTAVDAVDFDVRPGEIHALLGENGAGKSTLMNCLFGLVQPDEGEILIDGRAVTINSPRRAQELGIGMVHQHFKLVPSMTVAENVFLGSEPHSGPFLRPAAANAEVARLSREYGLDVNPTDLVSSLSVGAQQRVEILRALAKKVRVLILDEPTAVLTPAEADRFFEVVKGFAAQGLGIVLISHHLDEVRKAADRVTVLRRGVKVADAPIGTLTNRDLATLIIGEERPVVSEVPMGKPGQLRVEVSGLTLRNSRGLEILHGVDFNVHGGEIVGILGIAGNGQTEMVEAITGIRKPSAGKVVINGRDVTGLDPGGVRAASLGHIPEDRIGRGMAGYWTVRDNIAVGYLDTDEVGGRTLSNARISDLVARLMKQFDVRASSPMQLARRLSGGNAQKMVLARELSRHPSVVVCAEPTRGLDIAATEFVRNELIAQRDAGAAVLLVSSEIEEVTRIADRVLVISSGRIVARFEGRRPTEAEVGRAMLGEVA